MNMFFRRVNRQGVGGEPSHDPIVRLLDPADQPVVTPIEKLTLSNLKREGVIPFRLLVERVATELYQAELRKGAWILDIGLLGSKLFVPAIIDEIEARNGTLWQIENPGQL
jgi:hypothetical protein